MEMEQICWGKSICCDGSPNSLSTNNKKHPWLVADNLDEDGMVNFYSIDEQASKYRCRIPELGGMCIQGFCHGWTILSNHPHNVMWSLWNPATSKLIRLPPLEGSDKIGYCCLSSPPGDPSSLLLLTRHEKPYFVFCRLDRSSKRKRSRSRSRWTEMSYTKQLKRVMGDEEEGGILDCLTCCNGKVYALSHETLSVVLIDIKVVKDKQVVISILPFQEYPYPYFRSLPEFYLLKGSATELFLITGRLDAPPAVYLFKLDMTTTHDDTTTWEEIHDLKDAVFFVDLNRCQPVSYIPAVASGFGGYVNIRGVSSMLVVKSFHVKDKTLLLLPMACLVKATQVSMWEYRGRLEAPDNDRQVKCTDDDHKQQQEEEEEEEDENKENDDEITWRSSSSSSNTRLVDVPFHVLEMIMEYCVGIEYMNMRATCKRCHLAAPRIHWRNKKTSLEKYSLVSPWLMVVKVDQGIMSFTDPISGVKYFMKPDPSLITYDDLNSVCCSKYGWLLFYTRSSGNLGYQEQQLVFFNPFTDDVRKLPPTPPHYLESLCFSAPPTSAGCMVVGFSTNAHAAYILRYVADQLLWRRFDINVDYNGFSFPLFHGPHLYALCNEGQLVVFKDMSQGSFSQPEEVVTAQPPSLIRCPWLSPTQCFLIKRAQCLLLLIWGRFGADPKLFQLHDSTENWTQIQSLERDAIFIGGATCVCIQDATPKMQNKIYFPRFKHDKLIFFSLESSTYHTFDGKLATREEVFGYCYLRNTLHLSLNAWIQPSWR